MGSRESHNNGMIQVDPHPVIVTIRGNTDYIEVLLSSFFATITGWEVLLKKNCREPEP